MNNIITPEEYLSPRYLQTMDYPQEVELSSAGDIFFKTANGFTNGRKEMSEAEILRHPNIFKLLKWWLQRPLEYLPMYVKDTLVGKITVKVHKWNNDGTFVSERNKKSGHACQAWAWLPSTEEEYNLWQQNKPNANDKPIAI